MMKKRQIGGVGLTLLIVVLFFPTAAVSQSNVVINVRASGSDTVEKTFVTDIDWDDVYANPDIRYTWNLTDDYPDGYLIDLGTHTAKLEGLSVAVEAEPTIELGFSAVSEDGPATFLFTSDVLTFDPLTNVTANVYASASCLKGTTVSAVEFPGKLCRSLYNGTDIFEDVMDPFSFPGGLPAYVEREIDGEVSSMQLMWSLSVNSGGHATGLSEFEITGTAIPEPASILLLGLGGLTLIRKRRA